MGCLWRSNFSGTRIEPVRGSSRQQSGDKSEGGVIMLKAVELLRDRKLFPQYDGLVKVQDNGDGYAILNYGDECQYGKRWDEVTMACRGLIVDAVTWLVIALPFAKFFNFGEVNETKPANLPKLPFRVFEKIDGSLGIHYRDREGCPRLATRGSFTSEQAYYGEMMLRALRGIDQVPDAYTLLFEIVYRDNPSVVKYGYSGLVLLAIMNRVTGEEVAWDEVTAWANLLGCRLPKTYNFTTPKEAMASAKALPMNMEGYVLRFEDGLRVKMKSDDYLVAHRLYWSTNHKTALELLEKGGWDAFLTRVPEEIRPEIEAVGAPLILKAAELRGVVEAKFAEAPRSKAPAARREFAIWVQANAPQVVWPALFQMLDQRKVNYYKLIKLN